MSTIDMVFSLQQLREKCREQWQPLFVVFIDLKKVFDYHILHCMPAKDSTHHLPYIHTCVPRPLSFRFILSFGSFSFPSLVNSYNQPLPPEGIRLQQQLQESQPSVGISRKGNRDELQLFGPLLMSLTFTFTRLPASQRGLSLSGNLSP